MQANCTQKQRLVRLTQTQFQDGSIQLRPMQMSDHGLYVGLYTNPAVTALIGICCDAATASDWFYYALTARADTRMFYWVIECPSLATPIGLVALQHCDAGVAELGVLLQPACWRQGYGRRALLLLRDRGFASGAIDEWRLCHAPENLAMAGLAQRCGFLPQQCSPSASQQALPVALQYWCLQKQDWAAELVTPAPA